jgi:fumarylpyruvate hydrolase
MYVTPQIVTASLLTSTMANPAFVKFVVKQPVLSLACRATSSSKWTLTSEAIPVRRIYCVGRNYRDHAIEMGSDPDREPPFFFHKPGDALVDTIERGNGKEFCEIPYPPMTENFHHEVELVVVLGKGGLNIPVETASDHIFGYAVGCDLTRRDLQADAKRKGRPWCGSKGFDLSAPCGPAVRKEDFNFTPSETFITIEVNGEERQKSTLDKLTWSISETVSILSTFYTLQPGDLIYTGTPAGVGPLMPGDIVQASCGNLPVCKFKVGDAITEY